VIDASLVSELSMSGVYTLILFVTKEIKVTIERLGKQRLQRDTIVTLGQR
jgi:hypothetical protein